jgi:hypothetical protein
MAPPANFGGAGIAQAIQGALILNGDYDAHSADAAARAATRTSRLGVPSWPIRSLSPLRQAFAAQ